MMFSINSVALLLAAVLSAQVSPVSAVCAGGQMAVGSTMWQMFTGPNQAYNTYSGFLMSNNCRVIASNGQTQDENQMCRGGYSRGASVACQNNRPVSAVDTVGQKWNCSPTNDHSCDVGGSGGRFTVLACCSRA
ncbi:unnamed protein product [Rhizoctonia solani]|uniref:Cyanovirin-N domain-containing protein n=1 Tax=Rhizoctonia solani TaxID=456999 RepID=A0A8H3E8I5_9AGAM|nr:unnamed protein product [Rhizoctonia solani]